MPPITIDESRWPMVVVTFDGTANDDEFEAYLSTMASFLQRRSTTITVLDARRAGGTTAKQRKRQADWMREHEPLLRRHSLGTAFAITSTLVRGFLTAILWMQPLPHDHVVVATLEEAEGWAIDRLRARGIELPARGR